MGVKFVMHSAAVGEMYACSNVPNKPNFRRMSLDDGVDNYDAHACSECLGDYDGMGEVKVTKKRKGAPWHRPDGAGVCRDCGWWVPEDQR